jgi:Flp pilus assembly protein TadD
MDYAGAAKSAQRAIQEHANYAPLHRMLAAALGQLARVDEAGEALAWISQTRTYQGGEPGRHLHFSGTQDLVCW